MHPYLRFPSAAVAACILCVSNAFAQSGIPDDFENLKVLPEDIAKPELIKVMRDFAFALDARCETCHVGEAGQPLETFDFPSDEKATKKNARMMMRMVQDINNTTLAKLEDPSGERIKVRCVTCHRGQRRPALMKDVLAETMAEGGIDTTIAKYRELRENYYGSHTFDFAPGTLTGFAQDLAREQNFDDALALMDLNLEYNADNALLYYSIAEIYMMQGDRAKAVANMQKTLDMAPDSPWAGFIRGQIEDLKAAGSGP